MKEFMDKDFLLDTETAKKLEPAENDSRDFDEDEDHRHHVQ